MFLHSGTDFLECVSIFWSTMKIVYGWSFRWLVQCKIILLANTHVQTVLRSKCKNSAETHQIINHLSYFENWNVGVIHIIQKYAKLFWKRYLMVCIDRSCSLRHITWTALNLNSICHEIDFEFESAPLLKRYHS